MMRIALFTIIILITNLLPAKAQNLPGPGIEKNNFVPGERMVFQVYYGPLNAGRVDAGAALR